MKAKKDLKIKSQSPSATRRGGKAEAKTDSKPGIYQLIDIAKIKPSKENYRKTVNTKGLEELADSIRSKGILQPIVVRPMKGNGSFEIVTGHRRHSAAKDAGLKQMPCILKEYTDEEVLEIQVIENSQREDVNPMEEAVGFQRLIAMGKHTHETLAKKLGKSLSYVFGRLSLSRLADEVQKAVLSEKISLGHALILTRLKHASEQKEMMKEIIAEGLSVRGAADSIGEFSYDIKNAVFNTESCNKCPFLSCNQSVLFPELKKSGGVCMDRGCSFAKTRDHYKALLDEKKAQGFKVITDKKEAENLCSYNSKTSTQINPPGSGYGTPKQYKSECMKCASHHAWFLYENDDYRGKHIEHGEICLDKKCFEAMNRAGRDTEDDGISRGSEAGRISPYTIAAHAKACRDRFLRANLPGKISDVVRKRLILYHLCCSARAQSNGIEDVHLFKTYSGFLDKPIKAFSQYSFSAPDVIKNFVGKVPAEKLDEAVKTALNAICGHGTDTEAMLLLTPEAGIDMTKDFGPDEEFLNSKTKDELVKFIGTHKLTVEIPKSGKKGDIVKAILTQDLKGKHTKELKEAVEIEKG